MPKKKSVKTEVKQISQPEKKKRGWLLTTWIVIILVINSLVFILNLMVGSLVSQILSLPIWTIYAAEIIAALNIIFLKFMLRLEKWAFYALCITSLITIAINLYIGDYVSVVLTFLVIMILYLILRKKWKLLV
jgi:hypothetical protein